MPVTVMTATHSSQNWVSGKATSTQALFHHSFPRSCTQNQHVIQSSVTRHALRTSHISPSTNGFIWAVINAYRGHHHLQIRPEDIWFAILAQLNYFHNAHAEELRVGNLTHEGRKKLRVEDSGSLDYSDFAIMAARLVASMAQDLMAPDLLAWMMPDFTTTVGTDLEVALVLIMGQMKHYFSFEMRKKCGIPSVTLLGERKDWQDLLERVNLIPSFCSTHIAPQQRYEPRTFAALLRPVLRGLVESFDTQSSDSNMQFWGNIVDMDEKGCDPSEISGWITAFCFWDRHGRCLYKNSPISSSQASARCELEGVSYFAISTDKIPSGVASLTVTVDDKGEIYHARIHHQDGESKAPGLNTLQPLAGWFMCQENQDEEEDEAPVPKPFDYDDDFDAEAPLPAPFYLS
ncbi:hypothetical protein N0V90_002105 [Kalmusia sp. IMI 367209]|nr:hypothetical protein N0V90_002105 [Kalmusia sp. IMI 367209]